MRRVRLASEIFSREFERTFANVETLKPPQQLFPLQKTLAQQGLSYQGRNTSPDVKRPVSRGYRNFRLEFRRSTAALRH